MPQKPFWAHLPQIHILSSSPPCGTKFKKKLAKCWLKNFEQNEGLFVEIWQVVTSYAQNIILDLFAPNLYTRAQPQV